MQLRLGRDPESNTSVACVSLDVGHHKISMQIKRNELNKPGAEKIRSVFDATDLAVRSSFTGKIILDVIGGKTETFTTLKDTDAPPRS